MFVPVGPDDVRAAGHCRGQHPMVWPVSGIPIQLGIDCAASLFCSAPGRRERLGGCLLIVSQRGSLMRPIAPRRGASLRELLPMLGPRQRHVAEPRALPNAPNVPRLSRQQTSAGRRSPSRLVGARVPGRPSVGRTGCSSARRSGRRRMRRIPNTASLWPA